ncbi:uncharacterized protein PG998_013105 [Apiospora kogelbergensis]|uniref:uncharacterized protein n=1 Tax=Apiospora kogelbergensis TaxID=1337665 RepID=UPI00312F3D0D
MPSPPEFPQFSKLPPEIRLMIWEEFLAEDKAGRHVLIRHGPVYNNMRKHRIRTIVATRRLASPLLRVCREARGVFLEFFTVAVDVLCYNSFPQRRRIQPCQHNTHRHHRHHHLGVVYLNPATDIFVAGVVPSFYRATGVPTKYSNLLKRQSTECPRQVIDHIQNVLQLGPFDPDNRPTTSQWPDSTGYIDTTTLPPLRIYKYMEPGYGCHNRVKEWEHIKMSTVRETPQGFASKFEKSGLGPVTKIMKW